MSSVFERLTNLFKSNDKVHISVSYTGKRRLKDNKVEGIYTYEKRTAGTDEWMKHLSGEKGLGLVPITHQQNCYWGAIDIDDYNINYGALLQKFYSNSLPFVVCKSKSGGVHCYIFFSDPIPAARLRKFMSYVSKEIGFARAELYPKQDHIDESSMGNAINMPYFNNDTRLAIQLSDINNIDSVKELNLETFVEYAEIAALSEEEFNTIYEDTTEVVNEKNDFSDLTKGMPPCMQINLKNGVRDGSKNTMFLNMCVYCHKRYKDGWQNKVFELADKYFVDDMDKKEQLIIIKSFEKNPNIFYQCKVEPLCSHCNSNVCVTKEFGIDMNSIFPEIKTFTKIACDPPIWIVEFDDHQKLECTTEDIQIQKRFQKLCMERLNILIPRVKEKDWEAYWQVQMTKLIVQAPDADTSTIDEIFSCLKNYVSEKYNERKDTLNEPDGVYLARDGYIYFKLNDFRNYLIRKQIITKDLSKQKLGLIFQELKLIQEQLRISSTTAVRVRGIKTTAIEGDMFDKFNPSVVPKDDEIIYEEM